ncbi:MAG: hypothetical protein J6X33_03275 [Clostridiales bacterium]|nr:hypothetical protein [Clostridiales bacterium]
MSGKDKTAKQRVKGIVILIIAIVILGLMAWAAVSLTVSLVDQIAEQGTYESSNNGN